jgi:hypothetical protein
MKNLLFINYVNYYFFFKKKNYFYGISGFIPVGTKFLRVELAAGLKTKVPSFIR